MVQIYRAHGFLMYILAAFIHFFVEYRRACDYHISNCPEGGTLRSTFAREFILPRFILSSVYHLPKLYHVRLHPSMLLRYTYDAYSPPVPILGQFAACSHQRKYVERDYYQHRQESDAYSADRKRRTQRALL